VHIERALPVSWRFGEYAPQLDAFAPPERRTPAVDELRPRRLVSVNLSMPKEILHQGRQVATGIFKTPAEGKVMLRRLNLDGDGQADRWAHGGAFRAVYVYSLEDYDYWRRELGRDDLAHGDFGENFTVEGMGELVDRNPNGMSVREVSDLLLFNTDDLEGARRALSIPALAHGWKGSFEQRLAKAGGAVGTWTGLRDFVVDRTERESETITSFYLLPADGARPAPYLPGRLLTFELAIPG
jgi:MOSC domain-containing protein YiiM